MGGKPALLSCGPVKLAQDVVQLRQPAIVGHWERVIVIGTTSAVTKRESGDRKERELIAEIEAATTLICEVCHAGKIPLTILNPTLIYGCGMDQNLSRVYSWIKRFGFVPLASKSQGLRQPLHVQDLAKTITNAIETDPAVDIDSPVCGNGTVRYDHMIEGLFAAAGRKERLLRLPRALVPPVIGLSGLIPGLRGLNSEMFMRQAVDMIFDDTSARELLNHHPRKYNPKMHDFLLPESIQQIQQALV